MGPVAFICAFAVAVLGFANATVEIGPVFEPTVGRYLSVAEGERWKLTCLIVSSKSKEYFTWEAPYGSRLTDHRDTTTTFNSNNGTYTLRRHIIVDSFSSAYNGVYKCKHTDNGNEKSVEVEVVALTEYKTQATYNYGDEEISLSCETSLGIQAQLESWLKYDKTIDADEKYEILENGTLVIKKLDRDDSGRYVARYKLKEKEGAFHDCVIDYKAAPLILDMKKSVNRDKGESVEIECEVKGWPRAKISWQKSGMKLNVSDRVTFSKHGDFENAKLHIKDLEFDDEGKYTCVADSEEFNMTTEKSIKLRVKDDKAWLWPLLGILAEAIVLVALIFIFERIKKRKEENHPHQQ